MFGKYFGYRYVRITLMNYMETFMRILTTIDRFIGILEAW